MRFRGGHPAAGLFVTLVSRTDRRSWLTGVIPKIVRHAKGNCDELTDVFLGQVVERIVDKQCGHSP